MDNKEFDDLPPIKYVNEYKRFGNMFKSKQNGEKSLFDKLLMQTFISLIIIALTLLINNIDTVITNRISDGIRSTINWNVDFSKAIDTFANIKNVIPNAKRSFGIFGQNENLKEFIMPVEGEITSEFGERVHPVLNTVRMHYGIDINADYGVSIKSSTPGKVTKVGEDIINGKYIKITKDKYELTYAHCSKILVEEGKSIKQGDIIGEVGDTGLTSGPHLHFEIWEEGVAINPIDKLTPVSMQ